MAAPDAFGRSWERRRFRSPYLRNALWDAGYAVDTLETAADWIRAPELAAALVQALDAGLEGENERVHAFAHLSHVYGSGTRDLRDLHLPPVAPPGGHPPSLAGAQDGRQPDRSSSTAGRSATSTGSAATTSRTSASRRASSGWPALRDDRRPVRSRRADGPGGAPRAAGRRRPERRVPGASAGPPGRRHDRRPITSSRSTAGPRACGRSSSTRRARSSPGPGSRIEPYVSPQPGWAEQDPEIWWRALGEAIRRVLAEPAVRRDALAGVALTTQRASVVVVDAAGDPLRPAIVWLDQRRTEGLPPVGGPDRRSRSGSSASARPWPRSRPTPRSTGSAATSPRSGRGRPASCSCPGSSPGGWSVARSTRSRCQVGYVPFDYKRLRWSAPGDWKWKVAPVDPAMLPGARPAGRPARRDHADGRRRRPGSRSGCRSSPRPPTRPARSSARAPSTRRSGRSRTGRRRRSTRPIGATSRRSR